MLLAWVRMAGCSGSKTGVIGRQVTVMKLEVGSQAEDVHLRVGVDCLETG